MKSRSRIISRPWTDEYADLLRRFCDAPDDALLERAAQLGRDLFSEGVPPDFIAAGHAVCLHDAYSAGAAQPGETLSLHAASLLGALMAAYAEGYAAQQQVSQRLAEHTRRVHNEIEARRQTERELRQQRDFAQGLLDTAQAIVLLLDAEGRIVQLNRYTELLTGHRLEDVRGQDWFNLVVPEAVRPQTRAAFHELLKEQSTERRTYPITTADGQRRVIEWSGRLQYDTDGHVIGLLAVGLDVTQREEALHALAEARDLLEKRVEKRTAALRQSEERYRGLVESQRDLIVRVDSQGRFTYVNEAYCRMFGKRREELLGRSFQPLVHPDDLAATLAEMEHLKHAPYRIYIEQRAKTAAGWRWLAWEDYAIRDASGRIVEIQGVGRDITARKDAENQARQRIAILEAVRFAGERFLRHPGWRHHADVVLERLGMAADVCRTYLFENHVAADGRLLGIQRNEWVRPGVTPQIDNPDLQDVDYVAIGFESWVRILGSEGIIAGHVADFDEPMRTVLAAQEIKSILVVPVFVGEEWWGFLGFDETRHEREWSTAEVEALCAAAETLGAAIQRDHTEEEVRLFKAAADTAAYGAALTMTDGTIFYVNEAFARQHGWTPQELIGRHLSVLHTDEQMLRLREILAKLATHEVQTAVEVWHKRRDGSIYPTLMSCTLLRDADGQPQFMAATAIDITAQKEAERALRISEARYRTIVNDQTELVCRFDPAGRITFANAACGKMMQADPEELIGRPISDLISVGCCERTSPHLRALTPEQPVYSCETVTRSAAGDDLYLQWLFRALFDEQGELTEYQAVGRDVSARRRAEQEVRERSEQLAHVARLVTVGEMASGLAHEINQPLGAILYYAGGCVRRHRAGALDAEQAMEVIAKVADQARRAVNVIDRLRAFVRKRPLDVRPIDLNRIVRESVAFFEHTMTRTPLSLRLELGENLPPVAADEIQVQQVLLNLLQNAAEATKDLRGPERQVVVRTEAVDHDRVRCLVEDNGHGLSAEAEAHLFDSFFTTKQGGMGMGLAICRSIIEAHGGRIRAANNPRRGVTLEFTLPAVRS